MHKNAFHLLVAGALVAGAAAGEAQREVRVRETARCACARPPAGP